jgi:TolB-like protein
VPAPNTVAVLYFDNLTRDSAYTYLADGLSEELISRLGQVRRLDVKSRFESRRVRERRDAGTAELGRSLNVTYLLSGSVQSVGGRIRVSVELVRTPTGARVWSDVLNHAGSDLLGAQEEIVRSVVLAVVGQLLPEERVVLGRRVTRDSGAYDLYLRGRFFFSRHTHRDLQRAIELYEQALGRDSSFALGWAGIAQVWGWLADDFSPPLPALMLRIGLPWPAPELPN